MLHTRLKIRSHIFSICFIHTTLSVQCSMMQEVSVSLPRDVPQIFYLLLWDIFLPCLLGHGAASGQWSFYNVLSLQLLRKIEYWSLHLHRNPESLVWIERLHIKYLDAFRSDELLVNHIVNDTVPKPDQVLCVTKEVKYLVRCNEVSYFWLVNRQQLYFAFTFLHIFL